MSKHQTNSFIQHNHQILIPLRTFEIMWIESTKTKYNQKYNPERGFEQVMGKHIHRVHLKVDGIYAK